MIEIVCLHCRHVTENDENLKQDFFRGRGLTEIRDLSMAMAVNDCLTINLCLPCSIKHNFARLAMLKEMGFEDIAICCGEASYRNTGNQVTLAPFLIDWPIGTSYINAPGEHHRNCLTVK
jgi:hypothetical protein